MIWKPIVLDTPRKVRAFREKCANRAFLAKCIREHNLWRRGEGRYAWSDASGTPDPPLCPKALGIVLEEAARFLEGAE